MEDKIEELTLYYEALGFPMYSKEKLMEMSEAQLVNLYELTFPNR